jgi:hypothetical protein
VRLAAALALGAALSLAPAGSRGDAPERPSSPPPAPQAPPPGAQRVEVHVRFPPWQYTGTFRLVSASGTIDEGVARDDGGFAAQEDVVERVLEGANGTLVLRVQGGQKTPGFPPLFGRWSVVRGTGAYARAAGAGTFTSCGTGQPGKGSPFEIQTLLGQVQLRPVTK